MDNKKTTIKKHQLVEGLRIISDLCNDYEKCYTIAGPHFHTEGGSVQLIHDATKEIVTVQIKGEGVL